MAELDLDIILETNSEENKNARLEKAKAALEETQEVQTSNG